MALPGFSRFRGLFVRLKVGGLVRLRGFWGSGWDREEVIKVGDNQQPLKAGFCKQKCDALTYLVTSKFEHRVEV